MSTSRKEFLPESRSETFDARLQKMLVAMSEAGSSDAAQSVTMVVGETLAISEPTIRLVPLTSIPERLGGLENEAVGIYLRSGSNLAGQVMMVIPYPKALELADLLLGVPSGTTYHLGPIERSALAEMGNLSGGFYLNAIAALTGQATRLTSPAVMVDMVGAILDIMLASWDGLSENVLLVQVRFLRGGREAPADFWLIPDRSTLETIGRTPLYQKELAA